MSTQTFERGTPQKPGRRVMALRRVLGEDETITS
jgi:hypothetical protein